MPTSFLRSAATGLVIAAVAVTVVWLVARATGDDLRLTPYGRDEAERIPAFSPALFTLILGTIGVLVASLFRRRGWSALAFVGVAAAVVALEALLAFDRAETTGTALWLNAMHLVAATAIVPPLVRGIRRAI